MVSFTVMYIQVIYYNLKKKKIMKPILNNCKYIINNVIALVQEISVPIGQERDFLLIIIIIFLSKTLVFSTSFPSLASDRWDVIVQRHPAAVRTQM